MDLAKGSVAAIARCEKTIDVVVDDLDAAYTDESCCGSESHGAWFSKSECHADSPERDDRHS
jgi:hypothetical protein